MSDLSPVSQPKLVLSLYHAVLLRIDNHQEAGFQRLRKRGRRPEKNRWSCGGVILALVGIRFAPPFVCGRQRQRREREDRCPALRAHRSRRRGQPECRRLTTSTGEGKRYARTRKHSAGGRRSCARTCGYSSRRPSSATITCRTMIEKLLPREILLLRPGASPRPSPLRTRSDIVTYLRTPPPDS